ncbi:hypothetical protein TNCV_4267771 [Trichonephila clavipes]|nr:hypothetical protein TNCV_4267771 [Trichonephila clavipes]
MSIEVTKYDKGCWQLINQVVQVKLVDNSIWWQVKTADSLGSWSGFSRLKTATRHGSRWLRIRYTCFEEMEGKSCAWVEDDVVTAVGIFVLRLDDSGARHILESDEWGCKQLIHLGSRLQSVEACPTDAHLEQ